MDVSARDRPVAIGAMRLSTAADREEARAAQVLDAALDAGVTLIDTADAYALDERDVGHNERLVAEAIARHGSAAMVVTKGGLVRDGKRWLAAGQGQHLASAARASRERLGRPIDLYLLHAPDPQVPLATSVRALAKLVEDGVVARVGLSNVGRVQLEEALTIAEIAAVEVELGPHDIDPIRGGLVAMCAERGIIVLAHRPFGGLERVRKWGRDRELAAIAARHEATVPELLLAWLRALSPVIVPLPGPSTVATARSAARAAAIVLDDEARDVLDRRFLGPSAARLHAPPEVPAVDGREVVIVMGMPGAGKSTIAHELVGRGYARFNRDERGGKLDGIAAALDEALAGGVAHAVLDNTYATRASRAAVIDVAAKHRVGVRCVWLDTSIEDAQVNAVARLLDRYGRLPEPAELNKLARRDPAAFRPAAQFNWRRELEPPQPDEGFTSVERRVFVRNHLAGGLRALIVEMDVVRAGRPVRASEVVLVDGAAGALRAWAERGWLITGTAWQPAVAEGKASREDVAAVDARTCELIGMRIEIETCGHGAGPPECWCRKPMPGMGIVLARRCGIDLARSIHVGRGAADRGFAARLGMRFEEPEALLGTPPAVS